MNQKAQNITNILLEDEKPIDLKYYLHLVTKNILIILTFLLITITVAGIYTAKTPKLYRATAQMVLERSQTAWQETRFEEVVSYQEQTQQIDDNYFNTQKEIMLGPTVLQRVTEQLNLMVYFDTSSLDQTVEKVRQSLQINQVQKSRLVEVSATLEDPKLAANLANAVAENFIKKSFEDSLYYNQEILTWLQQDQNQGGYVTVTDPLGNIKRVKYEDLIETLPAIQADPVVRQLQQQRNTAQLELEALLRQYGERHPLIIKGRANLNFLKESIENEKRRIIETLKAKAEGQLKVKPGRIIEVAQPPTEPLPSKQIKIIGIAGIGSIFVTLLGVFLKDYFDDTIHVMEDLERKGVLIPFLGPLPVIEGLDKTHTRVDIIPKLKENEQRVAVEEAFRYIRVAINFSAPPDALRLLAVTSCIPGDGKSFVSTNLASSLALDGNRILLVDGDLRRPVLHNTFGIENETGLSNYLTSNVSFDSVVRETGVDNLAVVCSGPISPNPSEILGSDRMKQFLEEAGKKYDRIVMDCPPLTGIGDGFVVGSLVGHLIMVVAAAKTPVELIRHTQHQLDKMSIKLLGIILNRMDVEKERYGGYTKHYYSTYNKYYRKK